MDMATPRPRHYQLVDLDREQRESLLASRVSAMMAFVDAKGFPRLVPCWFLWDGRAFYTTSMASKFHVRCLRRNPRASMGVEIGSSDDGLIRNRQVKGVGEVVIFDDVDHVWGRRIREKYLGRIVETGAGPAVHPDIDQARVVIRLEPDSLSAHGGEIREVSDDG